MAENKKIWRVVLFLILLAVLILVLSFWKGLALSQSLAECLNQKGVVMYGSDACENCIQQKQMFGSDFTKIKYINCDFNKDECHQKGVTSYPVWFIGNRTLIGLQSLPELADAAQCKFEIKNQ